MAKNKSKEEQLQEIRANYNIGLEEYKKNNYKVAETQFVKALKPLLSKPLMKALHPENIPAVKAELLDAMYHLGQIYFVNQENKYLDNYSKAAAIFQYCAGFVEKYWQSAESTNSDAQEQEQESNIITKAEHYRDQAYLVEKHFLSSIGVTSIGSNNDIKTQYHKVITEYKKKLSDIREETNKQLSSIADLALSHVSERSRKIIEIYQKSAQFFINHDDQTKENAISSSGFVQRLLSDCQEHLGDKPTGLEFAVIGLGSLANGTITPWSDLEFGILINEDREEYREYCRNLTKLLHIKIINLGETPLRSVGIESLNNFRTTEKSDEWFWDDVINSGFSFDGPDWHACKHPLGRQGYKATKKVKNDSGIEETKIINKPDYELILTPEQLAEFQKEPLDGEESNARPSFTSDKHLLQALRSVCLIEGDRVLFDKYRDQAEKLESKEILQARSLEILGEDVEKFALKLGGEEEGKLMDVKKTIYRLPDRIINALANYYGISAAEGKTAISVWEMIHVMQDKELLSKEGAERLKEATSIAAELRLRTYSNNQSQGEGLSTYVPAVKHLTEEKQQELLHQTFYLNETNLLDYLHHFYYVMLRVQEVVKDFCIVEYHARAEAFLSNDSLYDDGNYHRGMVYARFLEYTKAVQHMQEAKNKDEENKEILQQLQFLYNKTGQIEDAIVLGKKILNLNINTHKDQLNNPDIAMSYNNLGTAYNDKGEYETAIEHHQRALNIKLVAYATSPNHSSIADSYNNLGSAYRNKGEYETAIEHHQRALDIKLVAYASNLNHPSIADSYNNLGNVYYANEEYNTAIEHHQRALDIKLVAYATIPNHPSIADSYNNLGNVYYANEEYNTAIEHHQRALDIKLVAYATIPNHSSIADSYNNLGTAYNDKGEYETVIEHHQRALDIKLVAYATMPNHSSIADSYNNLGEAYRLKGKYDAAIEHYQRALDIKLVAYATMPNHSSIADSYNNLGEAYRLKGKYDAAIEHYQRALDIKLVAYASSPNHSSIADSYNNLGVAYSDKKEYDAAIEQFSAALEVYKKAYTKIPDHLDIAMNYNNLGAAYYAKEEYDIAYIYVDKAMQIYSFQSLICTRLMNKILLQLCSKSLLQDNIDKAKDYYKKVLSESREIDFNSVAFIKLQSQLVNIAYQGNDIILTINCQRVLVKCDPAMQYGNHYHNLACFYACDGNIEEANASFMNAMNSFNISGGLYVEYAQFLLLNRNREFITTEVQKISQYLNDTINSDIVGNLGYGIIEKDCVCDILKALIKDKNSEIKVNPKILAYYLLIKYPEYIQEGDTIDFILESFQAYANLLQDEISLQLLEDGYKLVNSYQEKTNVIETSILNIATLDFIEGADSNDEVDAREDNLNNGVNNYSGTALVAGTEITIDKGMQNGTNIYSITNIKYDNELLNNPELIKILANKYCINKAIDVGSLLSLDLINEVIENNDHELLLAGALSVQQECT